MVKKKRNYKKEAAAMEEAALEQRFKELEQMKALALNGRPDPGNISIAGGSLISAGQLIGQQQAYDRNRAFMNNPSAQMNFLKTGSADVGGPRMRGRLGTTPGLEEESANLAADQLSYDLDRGLTPDYAQLQEASNATRKTLHKGEDLGVTVQQGVDRLKQRELLLERNNRRPQQPNMFQQQQRDEQEVEAMRQPNLLTPASRLIPNGPNSWISVDEEDKDKYGRKATPFSWRQSF